MGFIYINRLESTAFILFIKKSKSSLRFYIDYYSFNTVTSKNRYSLTLILKTLNYLNRAKIFTKLDIISAFNRLRIREVNEFLIIFYTCFGLFEYFIIPFSLYNRSISF